MGILSVSPDDQWVAVGTDFEGDERHHVTIRPLAGQDAVTDALDDVYYGFAWASDSRHFFYTRVDDAMRPWQLWRHELGTPSSSDVLVFQENDAQYTVSVGRSRDDAVIVILVGSSTTTEVHFLAADDPTAEFTLLEPRRQGIEYGVEHFIDSQERDWWLKVTNDGRHGLPTVGPSPKRWRMDRVDRRTHRQPTRRRRRLQGLPRRQRTP